MISPPELIGIFCDIGGQSFCVVGSKGVAVGGVGVVRVVSVVMVVMEFEV